MVENFRWFLFGGLFTFVLLGLLSFFSTKIDEYKEMKKKNQELEERLDEIADYLFDKN